MQIHLPKQATSSSWSKSVSNLYTMCINLLIYPPWNKKLPCFFMKIHRNLRCVGLWLKAVRQWTSKLHGDSQKFCPSSQRSRNISLKPQWTCCPNFWYFNLLSQRSRWCYPFSWVSKHAKIDWSHANTLNDEPDKLTANPSTYLVQPEMVYYLCLSIENNSTGTSHTLQSQEHQVNRGQHGLFRVAGFQKNNHARTEDLSWKLSEMFLMYFYVHILFTSFNLVLEAN